MCCDAFEKFIPIFSWMKQENGPYCMPYLQSGNLKMRINHCPSCGAYIRDISLKQITNDNRKNLSN